MQFFTSSEIEVIGLTENQRKDINDALTWFHKEMTKKIQELIKRSDYGNAVKELSIIPTIYSKRHLEEIKRTSGRPFPERRIYRKKTGKTDYRLQIDYGLFIKADEYEKKRLLVANVIEAIRDLEKKIKKEKFNAIQLENDIVQLFADLAPTLDDSSNGVSHN